MIYRITILQQMIECSTFRCFDYEFQKNEKKRRCYLPSRHFFANIFALKQQPKTTINFRIKKSSIYFYQRNESDADHSNAQFISFRLLHIHDYKTIQIILNKLLDNIRLQRVARRRVRAITLAPNRAMMNDDETRSKGQRDVFTWRTLPVPAYAHVCTVNRAYLYIVVHEFELSQYSS